MNNRLPFIGGGLTVAACFAVTVVAVSAQPPSKDSDGGKPAPVEGRSAVLPAVSLKTDKKTYKAGDPITITLTVKNTRKAPLRLAFSSGQKYDFVVQRGKKDPRGETVWQWSRGKMFTQALTSFELAPGKTQTYTEKFDPAGPQNDDAQKVKQITKGVYTVTGIVTTMGRAPRPSAAAVITVK